ncbi:fibulin-5 isoform X1 [Halyomorpha halys]|uniref:fibulin-5 n=1 Tax=Halyomorpha halys TaxID=286706 RepID=UPI0006D4F941|nr:fibrillin-1 [Halyomorpha halys]XP_014278052.1 fibrillin-1-like isoform X1 [Halyomorpha halys]
MMLPPLHSVLLIGVINGFSTLVKGEDIENMINRCCELGSNATHISECEDNRPVQGVSTAYGSFCLATKNVCCVRAVREIECEIGIEAAKAGKSCVEGFSRGKEMCSLDRSNCCKACAIGLESAIIGEGCNLGRTSFGGLWDSVYTKCCESSQEHRSKEIQDPSKNMCLMFADELCHHNCVPSGLSYRCTCRPGWSLMSDGKSCTPIETKCIGCSDEDCIQTVAGEMVCINCPEKHHLDADNKTCVRDEERVPTPNCMEGFRLQQYGNQDSLCEDIDECSEGLSECKETEKCWNTIGSYRCTARTVSRKHPTVRCRRGFVFSNQHGKCIDIDECAQTDDPPCDSNQNCVNTNGSFECVCKPGFNQDAVTLACVDINECQQRTHDCFDFQRCDNTLGSYTCTRDINCGTGYTLNSQSGKCEDDDECALGTHTCKLLGLEYECRNTQGSFRCIKKMECSGLSCSGPLTQHCPSGYRVTGSTCVDIDECEEGLARCGTNQRCINIRGNYLCSDLVSCKPGLKLNPAKTQCIDVDECAEQQGLCSHYCDNRFGSYRCRCKPGFKLNVDNRTCVDINECEDGPQRCQAYCINQQGSYTCSCPPGYKTIGFKNQLCQDINECQTSNHVCNEEDVCVNIAGSYRCNPINCPPGYRRDGAKKNRCYKEDPRCLADDLECIRQPTAYSYNYLSMVSNFTIPRNGLKLFTVSSSWTTTAPDFTLELVQARASGGVKVATRNDFNLNKQYGEAIIELVKPLIGPQEIQLELKTEFYNNGRVLSTQISSLEIYVSMYTF